MAKTSNTISVYHLVITYTISIKEFISVNKYDEIQENHIIEIDSKTIKMTRTMERDLFAFLFSDH